MAYEDYKSDDAFLASVEYLMDSIVNGQFGQVRKLIEDYGHTVNDLDAYLTDLGYDAETRLTYTKKAFGDE